MISEINEELGVSIKVHSYFTTNIHKYDSGAIQLISYIAELESGIIELREQIQLRLQLKPYLKI